MKRVDNLEKTRKTKNKKKRCCRDIKYYDKDYKLPSNV